ncbi:uncharacterized protein BKCO1_2600040 [Diplodia corticola]|uniref:Elongator complex protein 6 n=1 Tax=Diplodia corticola TaxID=236234 RepID=A0A1J9QZY4_9PEZI|nr:uncharacterized protein BKCO1_2600040 [Diplodia corticola]OJD33929.1 hypothetical protein BKCO1_2600040 [Diplodia corticola]
MPPSSSRIPPLLQPYVRLPPAGSLHLLTSVLGASTNWLVIRYLCGAFAGHDARKPATSPDENNNGLRGQDEDTAVILVSFLRDWDFWKTESRRAGGLDLARLAQQNRFAFVDGLSNLFLPADAASDAAPSPVPTAAHPSSPMPVRSGRTITPRTLPQASPQQPSAAPAATPTAPPPPPTFRLTSPTLPHLEAVVQKARAHLLSTSPARRILLVLDAPDLLLAATATSTPTTATTTPADFASTLLALRADVHAAVVSVSADAPLVAAAVDAVTAHQHDNSGDKGGPCGGSTPLEAAQAALVVGLAHGADWVVSLRLLDTGFAADVSGVLRVTRGDNADDDGDGEEGEGSGSGSEERRMEEKEVLYYIGGDGSAKVFERGAGAGNG